MKKFLALALFVVAGIASLSAQVNVRGYYRSNGTYVRPHVRTYPDGIKSNNYSYRSSANDNGAMTPKAIFDSARLVYAS